MLFDQEGLNGANLTVTKPDIIVKLADRTTLALIADHAVVNFEGTVSMVTLKGASSSAAFNGIGAVVLSDIGQLATINDTNNKVTVGGGGSVGVAYSNETVIDKGIGTKVKVGSLTSAHIFGVGTVIDATDIIPGANAAIDITGRDIEVQNAKIGDVFYMYGCGLNNSSKPNKIDSLPVFDNISQTSNPHAGLRVEVSAGGALLISALAAYAGAGGYTSTGDGQNLANLSASWLLAHP